MQPYFFPYLGYFQLIDACDKMIFYDDVNFIKGGWINRNKLLAGSEGKFFNARLCGSSQNKLIKDIDVDHSIIWRKKLLKNLHQSYSKAPQFSIIYPLIEEIVYGDFKSISEFNIFGIKKLSDFMHQDVDFEISSKKYQNRQLKGQERILDICTHEKCKTYINAASGKDLYHKKDFREKGIDIRFIKMDGDVAYRQFKNGHVPCLSIIDVLMFNDLKAVGGLLKRYTLE